MSAATRRCSSKLAPRYPHVVARNRTRLTSSLSTGPKFKLCVGHGSPGPECLYRLPPQASGWDRQAGPRPTLPRVLDDLLRLFGRLNMSKWPALSSGGALKGKRRRTALLVLLSLASIGLLSFAFLVSEVSRGRKLGFDDLLLVALRADDLSTPIGPSWLASMFRDITSLGSPTVVTMVTSLALAYFLLSHRFPDAVLVLFSVVGAALINTSVKEMVGRLRPDVVSHLVKVQTLSFPSGHSTL